MDFYRQEIAAVQLAREMAGNLLPFDAGRRRFDSRSGSDAGRECQMVFEEADDPRHSSSPFEIQKGMRRSRGGSRGGGRRDRRINFCAPCPSPEQVTSSIATSI